MFLTLVSCLAILGPLSVTSNDKVPPTPIVMWHGMGDTCCNNNSLGYFKAVLEEEIPGVYVKSLQFGDNESQDKRSGYYGKVNDQVSLACEAIMNDTKIANSPTGYNALGFSQGGQFLRAVAQRCPETRMSNLITFGSQHQGVMSFPNCPPDEAGFMCNAVRRILNYGAYMKWIQNSIIQAQYWHNPLQEQQYRDNSIFLSDINNEPTSENRPLKTEYKENLLKLSKLVLVQFDNDTMVFPKESSTFGWYSNDNKTVPFTETALYKEDRIGLKQLNEEKRLIVIRLPGDHLRFTIDWFKSEIIKKFLKSE